MNEEQSLLMKKVDENPPKKTRKVDRFLENFLQLKRLNFPVWLQHHEALKLVALIRKRWFSQYFSYVLINFEIKKLHCRQNPTRTTTLTSLVLSCYTSILIIVNMKNFFQTTLSMQRSKLDFHNDSHLIFGHNFEYQNFFFSYKSKLKGKCWPYVPHRIVYILQFYCVVHLI